jgi:hypothetical protein
MRLIDKDALIEEAGAGGWDADIKELQMILKYVPEIDAVPVVRGEWVKSDDYKGWLVCSACHDCYVDNAWVNGKKWRYCPNCGALMEDKS